MVTRYKIDRGHGWFRLALFVAAIVIAWPLTGYAEPPGVDVKIRAQNRSIDDTPFCGVGAGLIGDRLYVDAFMDPTGVVTGTARFEDANGNVTLIDTDSFSPLPWVQVSGEGWCFKTSITRSM